jgi:predicted AlkP superfamily pyrophosphatase or phosphodiesterase
MVKRSLFTALSLLFVLAVPGYGEFKAKNVVIVVGDQFRHDETFGDQSHQYIPHLWNDLVPNGSLCVTFYGNPSYLVLVHLAIITGSWNDVRRLEPAETPDQPTMFEYFRKGLGKDEKSCYFITSKPEFDYMNYSNSEDYGEDYAAMAEFTKEKNNDEELFTKLVANMKKNRPSLIFVVLGGAKSFNKKKRPEEVEKYRKQLVAMDAMIYRIWGAIQADANYKDKTDFFFLNDHGDLIDHEDCDDECKRYLVILGMGPDIKKKYVTENKWRQVNICPTVGKILKFPTPEVAKDAGVMDDFLIK